MPGLTELVLALTGCWRLLRFDASAFRFFDRSAAGAIRSFCVAIPVYLYYLLLIMDKGMITKDMDLVRYLAAMSLGYVFLWISFPLVLLGIAEFFEWRDRVPGVIAVYNWSALLTVALHLPGMLIGFAGWSAAMVALLNFVALCYMLVLNGFIFRRVLGIEVLPAALLVIGDFALSQLIILPAFTYLGGASDA